MFCLHAKLEHGKQIWQIPIHFNLFPQFNSYSVLEWYLFFKIISLYLLFYQIFYVRNNHYSSGFNIASINNIVTLLHPNITGWTNK